MIISRTPLRVSFFGGGTDFPQWYEKHGGAVLSTAIDKYIYVIVKKRFDDKIVLHYTKTEICDRVDEIQHDYIREAMRMCGVKEGVEITTLADIPSEGTGLGSSSSLAVGLIYTLMMYKTGRNEIHAVSTGYHVKSTKEILADWACQLEVDWLHKPIGKQDQYAAAFGGFNKIIFYKSGAIAVCGVNPGELESRLMLFYTGITRQASDILEKQVDNISDRESVLKEMSKSADIGHMHLDRGQLYYFGEFLHTNWLRKKELTTSISNSQIDTMYQKALDAGALGGKICGAGGGGFMLLYAEPQNHQRIRESLSDYQEMPFKFEQEGSKIIYHE